ncbi:hypothetical protein TRIUR3_23105 [Triticum urartu]|uniref:Uncharacterized protein n=1 Tax=Triticum urartu TaxID=4572 RepID=M7ZB20_TRIUA|nr:hypothetical protein TRIUR3_23105 [Triticum urartu]
MVKKHVSGTEDHPGWVYYRYPVMVEYVAYLVEKMFLTGDDVVDVIGWSEDRREELERRNEERRARGMMAVGFRGSCCEERSESLLQVGR